MTETLKHMKLFAVLSSPSGACTIFHTLSVKILVSWEMANSWVPVCWIVFMKANIDSAEHCGLISILKKIVNLVAKYSLREEGWKASLSAGHCFFSIFINSRKHRPILFLSFRHFTPRLYNSRVLAPGPTPSAPKLWKSAVHTKS